MQVSYANGTIRRRDLAVLPVVVLALSAWAPLGRAGDDELPKGEAVLDKYVEATGGKEAYAKLKNRVSKGTLEVEGIGMKGNFTVYEARPDKQYFVFEDENFGKIEEGSNGEVAWAINQMGPRLKKGEERTASLRQAQFDGIVNWRKLYKEVACPAVEEIDGKPCYKVVLTPKEGSPRTQWFDKQTGLLVKTKADIATEMGPVTVVVHASDYKEVDGVKLAHRVRQVVNDMQEMIIVTESVEHNVDLPADRFELPEDVKALRDKETP